MLRGSVRYSSTVRPPSLRVRFYPWWETALHCRTELQGQVVCLCFAQSMVLVVAAITLAARGA